MEETMIPKISLNFNNTYIKRIGEFSVIFTKDKDAVNFSDATDNVSDVTSSNMDAVSPIKNNKNNKTKLLLASSAVVIVLAIIAFIGAN